MDLDFYISKMINQLETIMSLTSGISNEQARWKPDPDSWSILEVINHLYDEERSDFRVRLNIILFHPDQPWPPIDPGGWVTERAYNERDLNQSRSNFSSERKKSIEWLEGLSEINWETTYDTPWEIPIRAGDMFAAWVAHDLLHTRQLVELQWAYSVRSLHPYDVQYAGKW